jgi:riboflavin transporter FmnP
MTKEGHGSAPISQEKAGSAQNDRKFASKAGQNPRWGARQLATMAIMLALGIILSFIEFPLLPGTDFLKFDASFVPSTLIGFSFGVGPGVMVGVLVAAVHALFTGNTVGAVMNAVIAIAFILPATVAYRRNRSTVSVIVGLVISSICMVVVALLMNVLITPVYMAVPLEAVLSMMLPILLPFNVLKALLDTVLVFLLQRNLRAFLEK